MLNPQTANPNDHKVVTFKNGTDFDFTTDMGCMFDSRPIFGISGVNGIKAGESMVLPYHIGHRLATNLAKAVLTRQAPQVDPAGIPTGVPLWDETGLERIKNSFITELYTENSPIAESQTDVLMRKVEELRKMVEGGQKPAEQPSAPQAVSSDAPISDVIPPAENGNQEPKAPEQPKVLVYKDKAEVIAELQKRGIVFDARQKKENLEKLLA